MPRAARKAAISLAAIQNRIELYRVLGGEAAAATP